ncbi:MAG: GNAT family N-acetyltransferase [Candidatus Baldrarchaeia archaeon]
MVREVYGKLKLNAEVYLMPGEEKIDADVYIHLKGYARARVTHLDVEKIGLGRIIYRGRGNFLQVGGVKGGIEVWLRDPREIKIGKIEVFMSSLKILCPLLNRILKPGEVTRCWVGRKYDGIYIGFKKDYVRRLEEVAYEVFGIKPLEVKIRLMEKKDLEEILNMFLEEGLAESDLEEIEEIFSDTPEFCFVAVELNKIVGAIFGHVHGEVGELEFLLVKSNYRKRGIGTSLVRKLLEKYVKKGIREIYVCSSAENIQFYEKIGFKVVKRKEHCKEDEIRLKFKC